MIADLDDETCDLVVYGPTLVQTATARNDVTWPRKISSYARAVARNREAYPVTAGMPANIFPCAFWPYHPAEPPTKITSTGPSNILMIQNLRDPATHTPEPSQCARH